MSLFDLQITFTGLCAFVPDVPFSSATKQVNVVMPDGDSKDRFPKNGIDNKRLRRHRCFVSFNARNLKGMSSIPGDVTAIRFLRKQDVTFTITGDSNDLSIGSMVNLADFDGVAPGFNQVDPDNLTGQGKGITTRITIAKGSLATAATSGPWRVPPILSPTIAKFPSLAHEVTLTFSRLTSFVLSSNPLASGVNQNPLEFESDHLITMSIVNLCEKNPMQWETNADSKPDSDFKWYFELLPKKKRQDLAGTLAGLELPILVPEIQPDGLGANCFPVQMKA